MTNIVVSKILNIILLVVFYFAFTKLFIYFLPFVFGWIISIIIEPLVSFLQKKMRLFRGLASFISLIVFISLGGLLISFLGSLLIGELTKLVNRLPKISTDLNTYIYYVSSRIEPFFIDIPSNISNSLLSSLESILNSLTKYITVFATSALNFLTAIPNVILSILFSFISAFFISKDKAKIVRFFKAQLPNNFFKNSKTKVIREDLIYAVLGYIKAQLILMSITFVESLIGLTLLGVNYSILIALVVSFVDALPVLGSGSIYIPWIIFKLISRDFNTALFLFILYLIITLVRQTFEPKILSTQIGLYPLVTLMSIYIGLKVFGFIGIILGPIIVITLIALQKIGIIPPFRSYK